MVFSAHAADFCSRAGGTIMRFVELGGTVQVCDMTFGERCESPALWAKARKPTLDEVKKIRKMEIDAAAEILGASIDCLDFGDSPLVLGTARRIKILAMIQEFKPDVVLSHWINDILHPDHVETAQAVLRACCYCSAAGIETGHEPCRRPSFYCFETTLGTAPVAKFFPDVYVDITSVFKQKISALMKLAAQPQLSDGYEVLGRFRGLEAMHTAGMENCRYAEGFVNLGRKK